MDRIRGAKSCISKQNDIIAEKIASLLSESKASYGEINEIFQAAKEKLHVSL